MKKIAWQETTTAPQLSIEAKRQKIDDLLPVQHTCRDCYRIFVVESWQDTVQEFGARTPEDTLWAFCPHCGKKNLVVHDFLGRDGLKTFSDGAQRDTGLLRIREWWRRLTGYYEFAND